MVIEEAGDRYRVEDNSMSKLSESIRDTPQSMAMISKELLDDRGVTSLNDALRNTPGITLGAGEFSWQGNNPTIRGFSARDDLYLDGLRDFGSYPRDPFNLETVEVLLGPSSILFGRGSTGGAINQVTKQPLRERLTSMALNVGSDDTVRATADLSRPVALLGDTGAFRLNALAHRGEVAERNGARMERFGIAPSLSVGIGTDTQATFGYMKQTSDDRPDYGLPWLGNRPAPAERDRFYGFDSDYLETDADILSTQVLHRVSDTIRLDIQARYADYEREQRITEPLHYAPRRPRAHRPSRSRCTGTCSPARAMRLSSRRRPWRASTSAPTACGMRSSRASSCPVKPQRRCSPSASACRARACSIPIRRSRSRPRRSTRGSSRIPNRRPPRCSRSTPGSSATRGT